jgi:transcriptional regulator with XRE-family HTH domain
VDNRSEIRDFLVSRRARITPRQAGLPAYGTNRRVPGLRREEAALLAGISVEYYTRLERGSASGVSADVLEAIARALQLDDAERAHLIDLVRSANATHVLRRRPSREQVRPVLQRILDAMPDLPAYVRNERLDILSANRLGQALYTDLFADPTRPVNMARFIFLNPRAPGFFRDWDGIAGDAVAILRAKAGRDPHDRGLTNLIGELSTRSEAFRVLWAAHNVRLQCTYVKSLHHPVVGDLTLTYEALRLSADPGLRILIYTAEPDSPSQDALNLLASWNATPASGRITSA